MISRRSFRVTSVAVGLCSVLAVSACGGGKTSQNAGGPRAGLPAGAADPCRLATPAQVAAAVGSPVSAPLRSSLQGSDGAVLTCTWRGTAADPQSVAQLDVYPSTAAYTDARKTQSGPAPTVSGPAPTGPGSPPASATGAAAGSGFHALSGVGDDAFAGDQGVVWVRKGASAFSVHWFDPRDAPLATVAKGTALAKVVAANL
jgi:hypothetical protein